MRTRTASTAGWKPYAKKCYAIERNMETNHLMLHVFDKPQFRDDWVYKPPRRRDVRAKFVRAALSERQARMLYRECADRQSGSGPVVHKMLAM